MTPNQNEMAFLEPPTSMPIDHHFVNNINYINNRNSLIMNDTSPFEDMDETDYTSTSDGFIINEKLPRPNVFCCAEGLSVKSLLNRASGVGQETGIGGNIGSSGSGGGHSSGLPVQIITDSKGVHHTTVSSSSTSNESEIKVGGYIIRENNDDHLTDKIVDNHVDYYDEEEDDANVDDALECIDIDKKCDYCIKPAESVKSVNKLVDNVRGGGTISDDDFDNITIDRVRRASYGGGRLSLPSTSTRNNDILKFVFTDHGIRVISDKEYVV